MADDFIGSIAQEDVDFVTEIVKKSKIGDNYKHLAIYTETTQVNPSANFNVKEDNEGNILYSIAEVTGDNYAEYVAAGGALKTWLADYFAAGGQESVFIINVDGDLTATTPETYSEARLTVAFNLTKQLAYFKSICIADADVTTNYATLPSAAVVLATLCAADKLLSAPPLLDYQKEVVTELDDPVYVAVKAASKDAFFSYAQVVTVDTDKICHNGAIVSLGLALAVTNDSGTYVSNSFDMVKTDVLDVNAIYGAPLSPQVQNILKAGNVQYWKYVGDSTGNVAARGASTIQGSILPALWMVAFCNYYNKCQVASYLARRNVKKDGVTYNVLLSMLATTASKFTSIGRISNFMLTAPAFANLPPAADDTIVVENAWSGYYVDDLRTVKIYGSLTM